MADVAPSMPSLETANLGQNSKNVFTELFGKDASQKSGLMNTVAAQQERKTSFFGSKPKQEDGLTLKSLKKDEHPNHPGAAVLKASFLILLLVVVAAFSQNSSRFSYIGVNPALQKEQAQNQVSELQAEVNMQDHLAAVLLLDQFSTKVDEYFYNLAQASSEYSSENKKTEYEDRIEKLKPELTTLLTEIQSHLSTPMTDADVVAAQVIVDELITNLHAKNGEVDEETLLQDIQDLQTTRLLMQEASFRSLLTGMDLTGLSKEDFESVYNGFSTINASVTATISNIKAKRVEWSTYWDEIESLTKNVDPLFNTEFSGSLQLDDVRFNSDGTITVKGKTTTQDTKNFSLVSDLIDAYEASSYFKDVEDRTYSKNDVDETYMGNFRINLTLEP